MYRLLIRPFLFLLSPETVHWLLFSVLRKLFLIPGVRSLCAYIYTPKDVSLKREVFGIQFDNPVGLAAGFDKDARLIDPLTAFGFGFIEIGTVTPLPQSGNPKPRIFRLTKDQALINRMGFNNDGADEAAKRLRHRFSKVIVGGNIGKNKVTENEEAEQDYEICFEKLFPFVDYFVVNVSSPNTPGLRELQNKDALKKILVALQVKNALKEHRKPILLKIAPDLRNEQLDDIITIVKETGIDGVVATNTTIERGGLQTPAEEIEKIGAGGLSGKPLVDRSTEVIRYLCEKSGHAFPVIGVGGIHSATDAVEKLKAGASLVQIYTGFIYEGPALIKKICKEIIKYEGIQRGR
ncbi:MAG: quinone-dependent dihydroorotate dehydrogenase [Flavobacteriales bacterium]|nr:quinone-dependent dihydroorotate dehydrogenase [Flavobacteriales bacterium]